MDFPRNGGAVLICKLALAAIALLGVILDVSFFRGERRKLNTLSFFTDQTNLIVAVVFCLTVFDGFEGRPTGSFVRCVERAMRIWIVMTGVVFHSLLAKYHKVEGVLSVSNQILHTIVPVGVFLLWFFLGEKGTYRVNEIGYWVSFPIVYCAVAMVRGRIDGFYPYWFINPNAPPLGAGSYGRVARWVCILALACVMGGLLFTAMDFLFTHPISLIGGKK